MDRPEEVFYFKTIFQNSLKNYKLMLLKLKKTIENKINVRSWSFYLIYKRINQNYIWRVQKTGYNKI